MAERDGISLRERHREQTRAVLLDAAATLFSEKGYTETTIGDLVRLAGTSRATFYAHFPGKDAIVRSIVIGMWDTALELYRDFGALPDWSEPALRAWLGRVVDAWEASGPRLRVGAARVVRYDDFYLDYHRRFIEALTANAELWGRFSPAEAERRALLLISGLELFLNTWLVRGWPMERGEALGTLTAVWSATLNAPEAPRP